MTAATTALDDGSPGNVLWEHLVPAGTHWSARLRRGTRLRLTDLQGGANASVLLFNAEDPLERYNMPDTLKAQHTATLTQGHVLYSDMGRVLASLVADTCGWHDPLCGVTDAMQVSARFGQARYQESRNEMYRSGQDALLIELGKYGLGLRDLGATVNFFSKVTADEHGHLHFHAGHAAPGALVELRCDMDLLVLLSTSPHPLDPAHHWSPAPVQLTALRGLPAAADDPCRLHCPENTRGMLNTERYLAR